MSSCPWKVNDQVLIYCEDSLIFSASISQVLDSSKVKVKVYGIGLVTEWEFTLLEDVWQLATSEGSVLYLQANK